MATLVIRIIMQILVTIQIISLLLLPVPKTTNPLRFIKLLAKETQTFTL